MAKALYKQRLEQTPAKPREFRLTGLLAISLAFALIQINLAATIPPVASSFPLFSELPTEPQHLGTVISGYASRLGTTYLPDPLGSRIFFIIINLLTALIASAISSSLFPKSLAGPLTLVFLQTSFIFGLSGFLARPEALATLSFTVLAFATCRLIQQERTRWWLPMLMAMVFTLALDPRFAILCVFLVAAPLSFKMLRPWLTHPGYWATTLTTLAIPLLSFAPSLKETWGLDLQNAGDLQSLASGLSYLVIFVSPPIAFVILNGVGWIVTNRSSDTPTIAVFALIAPVLMLAALLNFDPSLVIVVLPTLLAITAGVVIKSPRFFLIWLSEYSIPMAFAVYLVGLTLLIFPNNELTARLPIFDRLFGWETLARDVNATAERHKSNWIAVSSDAQKFSLSPYLTHGPPVLTLDQSNMPQAFCHTAGLFLTPSHSEFDVVPRFQVFRKLGVAWRSVEGRGIAAFTLYHVISPTSDHCDQAQ